MVKSTMKKEKLESMRDVGPVFVGCICGWCEMGWKEMPTLFLIFYKRRHLSPSPPVNA